MQLLQLGVFKVGRARAYVTVHAYVPSNGICRGFAFKYGKFLLPPRFLTALSVPKVPTCEQYPDFADDKEKFENRVDNLKT